jgi:hypothetical protein
LERLHGERSKMEGDLDVADGTRPNIAGHARTTALVSAMWNAARPLSKRLRLSVVPGGPSKIRPIASVYPETEKE